MPNMILIPESAFIAYTPAASTEASGFPDDNAALYRSPSKEWRSTVKTETTIVCDTGAVGQPVAGVFLHGVNFEDAVIQGCASDSWGAPSFSEEIEIAQCPESKRWKGLYVLTNFEYRYLRLKIPAQDPIDGEAFFRIGALVLCSEAPELAINPKWGGYPKRMIRPAREVEFEGGSSEFVQLGLHRLLEVELAFSGDRTHAAGLVSALNLDLGTAVILYENGVDGGGHEAAWLMQVRSQLRIHSTGFNQRDVDPIQLREMV